MRRDTINDPRGGLDYQFDLDECAGVVDVLDIERERELTLPLSVLQRYVELHERPAQRPTLRQGRALGVAILMVAWFAAAALLNGWDAVRGLAIILAFLSACAVGVWLLARDS